MASVTATFEIRNDRSEEHEVTLDEDDEDGRHPPVNVSERRRREITASRELEDVEDAVWAIEADDHEIVWDLWEHINGEDYDEWGFYSPYPDADVSVDLNHEVSLHDVVWHIAQREDAEPPGVYLDLIHDRRIYGDLDGRGITSRLNGLIRYLEAAGVDASYWTHGRDSLSNMGARKFPDDMLDHAGYDG